MKKILSLLFIIININAIGQSLYIPVNNNDEYFNVITSDLRNNNFIGIFEYSSDSNNLNLYLWLNNGNNYFKKINSNNPNYYSYNGSNNSSIKQLNDSLTVFFSDLAYYDQVQEKYGISFFISDLNHIIYSEYIHIVDQDFYLGGYYKNNILESTNYYYLNINKYYATYIVKISKANNAVIWIKKLYTNESGGKCPGFDIALTNNEEIIGVSKNGNYMMIYKLNSNGNLVFSKTFNDQMYRHPKKIKLINNDIIIAGRISGSFYISKHEINNANLVSSFVFNHLSEYTYIIDSEFFIEDNYDIYINSLIDEYDTLSGLGYYTDAFSKFNINDNTANFKSFDNSNYNMYKLGNSIHKSNDIVIFDAIFENSNYQSLFPVLIRSNNFFSNICYKKTYSFEKQIDTYLMNAEIVNNSLIVENVNFETYPMNYTIENASFPTSDLCLLLSEKENDISNPEILVYPNPANDKVYINIPENNYQHLEIEIIDFSGKTIKKENTVLSNNYIDVNHLNNGVYFLRISLDNQILYSTKLLINR